MLAPTRELVAELNRRAPVIIVWTVPRPGKKCVWETVTGRVSAT
jgi:hypothetical protein